MDALAKALPDAFIADAPWAYPSFHPGFPFAEYAQRVNARMPQAYWTEIDNRGARYHLPRIDAQWEAFHAKNPTARRPVWPVGVTYGREHPSHPPGNLSLSDIALLLDRYEGSPVSLYTYEAALYAKRAIHATTLDYLKNRAVSDCAPGPFPSIP